MPTGDVAYQQTLKIRRTTLGFGVIQVILGLALTALSFTAFVLSESEKIRNACPYWAGFTVFCSGGVGIVAWRHSSVVSMGLFTFFSAVCVVLHMIGTILTGEVGGLLKSLILCHRSIINQSCMCCDSIMTCKQKVPTFKFEGVEDCGILTGLLKELLYGLCVLNIFGSLVCFIATILGCTSVARQAGRDQPLFRRRLSAPSDSHDQSQYSWLHYPTDLNMLPPCAPPIYRSVDNFQDCMAAPYIVPPPVFDPTDLPPPYSSRNASLSSSGLSLYVQRDEYSELRRNQHGRDNGRREGRSSIVVSEIVNFDNQSQQRIYSVNRSRPGNPGRTSRNGVLEFRDTGSSTHLDRSADQSLQSSRASLQSEARRPIEYITQRIEGIAERFETRILQRCEEGRECKETDESLDKLDGTQGQCVASQHNKTKRTYTSGRHRYLSDAEQSTEIIHFEESPPCNKRTKAKKMNIIPNKLIPVRRIDVQRSALVEEDPSSYSDVLSMFKTINQKTDPKRCIVHNETRNVGYNDIQNNTFQREQSRAVIDGDQNGGIISNAREDGLAEAVFLSDNEVNNGGPLGRISSTSSSDCFLDGNPTECRDSSRISESSVDCNYGRIRWNVIGQTYSTERYSVKENGGSREVLLSLPSFTNISDIPTSDSQPDEDLDNCKKFQDSSDSENFISSGDINDTLTCKDQERMTETNPSHCRLIPVNSISRVIPSVTKYLQLSNESMTENCVTDVCVTENCVTDGFMSNNCVKHDHMTDNCVTEDCLTEDYMSNGCVTHDRWTDNGVTGYRVTDHEVGFTEFLQSTGDVSDLQDSYRNFPAPIPLESRKDSPDNNGTSFMDNNVLYSADQSECFSKEDKKYTECVAGKSLDKSEYKNNASERKMSASSNQERKNMKRKYEHEGVNKIHQDRLPVQLMDGVLEDWERLRIHFENDAANDRGESFRDSSLCGMSSGRSSVDYNHDDTVECESPAINIAETLSDSGYDVENISANKKPLARSDTCIAIETKYRVSKEKIRTCSDPEVTGLGIRKHRSCRSRGRLMLQDYVSVAPPNIELPFEIRNQGLGYFSKDTEIPNRNAKSRLHRSRRNSRQPGHEPTKCKPKASRCKHPNRESSRRIKDDMLRKEKAMKKTINLRNEISRSFLQLYKEKKLSPSARDPENSRNPSPDNTQNILKRRLVQEMSGQSKNCGFASSVDSKTHRKHYTKDLTNAADRMAGKETFV